MRLNKPTVKRPSFAKASARDGLMFIAPWLVGTVLFFAFPLIYSLTLSFFELENGTMFNFRFEGIKFYKDSLLSDVYFVPKFIKVCKQCL